MSCKYLYKSDIKKNKTCSEKLDHQNSKYCKTHKTVMKAQATKRKNERKRKRDDFNKHKILPPLKRSRRIPPKHNSISTDTNNLDALNLFNFPMPSTLQQLMRQIGQPQQEEKEEEKKEDDPNYIKPTEIKFNVDINHLQNINGLLNIIKLYKERPVTEESTINYDLEKIMQN